MSKKLLRAVRDWMDDPKFRECPIPNPLASAIRIAVANQRARWYVGVNGATRQTFAARGKPTPEAYPEYAAVIGPFRTRRGARYAALNGHNNPHIQCVADAERSAAREASGHWDGRA